ncbi:MAG: amino acid ABC transporter substrate-binding protein, partial [Bacillota bacterium]|nr:amino acid ABC transporter substrate-binding protein [Bacillota bacterium]
MKKLTAFMVALVMMFAFAACGGNSNDESNKDAEQQSQSLDAIKEAGEIVMFTNAEFPPFEYR